MKILLLIFILNISVKSQNFFFEHPKIQNTFVGFSENYILNLDEYEIILLSKEKNDTLTFELNKLKQSRKFLSNEFMFNYYNKNKYEKLTSYLEINYGNITLKLDGKNLIIKNLSSEKILLNNRMISDKELIDLYDFIIIENERNLFGEFDYLYSTKEDRLEDAEVINEFSSYIGSYNSGKVNCLKTDSKYKYQDKGNIYISGFTESHIMSWYLERPASIFHTPEGIAQFYYGYKDNYLIKVNDKNKIEWVTIAGGIGEDLDFFIDINDDFISATTCSNGMNYFTTDDAFQHNISEGATELHETYNYDAIFCKIRLDSGIIDYSTYFGEKGKDELPVAIKIDEEGNSWIFLNTTTRDLQTSNNAFQKRSIKSDAINSTDVYILCFNKYNQIIYSSYFSSSKVDKVYNCELVGDKLYFSGLTFGNDFPGFEISNNNRNYLACINTSDFKIEWVKNYEFDVISDILKFDEDRFITLSRVRKDNLSIGDSVYKSKIRGSNDLILSMHNLEGEILKATYLDVALSYSFPFDSNNIQINSLNLTRSKLCLDKYNNIFVGFTTKNSSLATTYNAIQKQYKLHKWEYEENMFFMALDSTMSNLRYSTYWAYGFPNSILFKNKSLYIGAETQFVDEYNTLNAYQRLTNGAAPIGMFSKLRFYPPDVKDTCTYNDFEILDFSEIEDFTLVQDAGRHYSTLLLTRNEKFKKGAIYFNYPVIVDNGFVTEFTFGTSKGEHLGFKDGSIFGADGFSFVITDNIPENLGYSGGGLCYEDLENILAVEVDLHRNITEQYNDPNGNHIAVFCSKDKITANHRGPHFLGQSNQLGIIRHDLKYRVKIVYSYRNETLKVFFAFADDEFSEIISVNNFNIKEKLNLIDDRRMYIGIGASTGDAIQEHKLYDWSFCGADHFVSSVDDNIDALPIVYPNPSSDIIELNTNLIINDLKIIDLIGNVQKQFYQHQKSINISELKPGIYFILINNIERVKFIKI